MSRETFAKGFCVFVICAFIYVTWLYGGLRSSRKVNEGRLVGILQVQQQAAKKGYGMFICNDGVKITFIWFDHLAPQPLVELNDSLPTSQPTSRGTE